MARPLTLKQAQASYPHRFTMEHVPAWALHRRSDGTYYAPHYRSDQEWYERTKFPGEAGIHPSVRHCQSDDNTWPLGKALDKPYSIGGNHG